MIVTPEPPRRVHEVSADQDLHLPTSSHALASASGHRLGNSSGWRAQRRHTRTWQAGAGVRHSQQRRWVPRPENYR